MKLQNRKKVRDAGAAGKKASEPQPTNHPSPPAKSSFPIVGIGASAGGLEAFTDLLKHLPTDTGSAFVLVQHLDPQHESALSQLLGRVTPMPVQEVTNNLRVKPNHIYAIPPNRSLIISQGILKLQPRSQNRTPARTIDAFFESLAQDKRERAIGVVLSGTASDGTVGLEAIKAEGGITFAQDDSARYDSMPRSAVAAGCVDFVLKPEDIAKELVRIARHPYVAGHHRDTHSPEDDRASATSHEDDQSALPPGGHGIPPIGATAAVSQATARTKPGHDGFKKIVLLLRNHSGVDFSLYKSTTIQRRINRRVVLNKQTTLDEYATFLRGDTKELDALYSDVLISVTSFFRNPEAFDLLKSKVFPKLLQQRRDQPVRVWVLGCSTGQEAYSIAMAYVEATENAPRARKLQVFATDLNDALLDKARHALYAKTLAQDVSPERLRRFFVEEEAGYRVAKPLREMVVFARQNLISDPPFSRIDLISCRNLLIYLEPSLQQKAIPTFHYALNPEGFLFLGASESIGGFTDLFEPADRKHKIFARKAAPTHPLPLPVKKDRAAPPPGRRPPLPLEKGRPDPHDDSRGELSAQREADRISVNQFTPPGVLINASLQILQFRGPTGPYLQPPTTGKATFDILKMAREGLMLPLRAAINKARKENKTVRRTGVRVQQNGKTRAVSFQVIPLKNLRERCFLILFEDTERAAPTLAVTTPEQALLPAAKKENAHRINALETELSETRDYLQSIQEQHEAAHEELQASNEEVQSANEELQSINEELETSKEELESANEELTTVNEEMAHRNAELNRLNADLTNFHASTKLPIVLLGRDLSIREFTSAAAKIFHLLATDIGRPLNAVRHNLFVPEAGRTVLSAPQSDKPLPLEEFVRQVIDTVHEQEREAYDHDGRWYSLRARPYFTVDNKVDGAVLVLVDTTELKATQAQLKDARDYAEAAIRTVPVPIVILRADLRVNTANEAFYNTFETPAAETEGRLIFDLGNQQWNIPKLRTLLEEVLPRNKLFKNFEVTHEFPNIGLRTMLLNARRVDRDDGTPEMILLAIEDITERKHAAEALRISRDQVAAELAGTQRLQQTSTLLIHGGDIDTLFRQILDAAIALLASDAGSIQRFHPDRGELRLLASKGFDPESAAFWEWVRPGSACTCGVALRTQQRVIVPDVEACNFMAGTQDLDSYRRSGIRAVQSTPLLSRSGQVVGMISTHWRQPRQLDERELRVLDVLARQAADLIERAQTEQARSKLASIVESSDDAIISKDLNGVITSWNKGAERLFGHTAAEAIGQLITILMPPDRVNEEPGILQRIRRGESIEHYETVRQCKDGVRLDVSLTVSPIKNEQGQVIGASQIARDITDRKRTEESLRQAQAQLADRAGYLEQAVTERTAELTQTNKQLEAFIYSVAHDLRAPLRAMQGFSSMLVEEAGKALSKTGQNYARRINRSALFMDAMLIDMLAFSRIGQQRLVLVPVNLETVIRSILSRLEPDLKEKNARVEAPGPWPMVLAHQPVLEQILFNLVSNALKFVSPGTAPQIRLRAETPLSDPPNPQPSVRRSPDEGGSTSNSQSAEAVPKADQLVRVWVEDNGIGIPAEHQAQIFRLFNRLHGSKYEGTGIGLAIVQKGIERIGGNVGVQSVPGQGSRFWIDLRKAPAH